MELKSRRIMSASGNKVQKETLQDNHSPPPDTGSNGHGIIKSIIMLAICFGGGIVFGFASEKGRVFEPVTIRLQMVFRRWIMMKMFLSAMATGMICLAVLSIVPIPFFKSRFTAAANGYENALVAKNAIPISLGAFMLGIGMTMAGACPGMVLPQVGAWTHQAIFTLLGALAAALCYGLLHDAVYEKIFPNGKLNLPSSFSKLTGVKYVFAAVPLGCVIFGVVVVLEIVVKWYNDIDWSAYNTPYLNQTSKIQTAPSVFQLVAWPPSLCGALIGLMQVTIVLAAGDTLGGSSAYCTVVSQPFVTQSLKQRFPYLAAFQKGIGNWWQVLYVTGAVAGGAISSALSKTIGQVAGVPVVFAFFGGFFLLFGARLSSGCTSGHGLSGSGLLLLGSFLAIPSMFAGAIAVAFVMDATGELMHLCDHFC